jgi:glycosyltransferase involved in cell wall biosynthesis
LANEIFPRVKKLLPEIELHVAGSFDIYNYKSNEVKRKDRMSYNCLYKDYDKGILKDGCFRYGSLTQKELDQFMHEGTLLVYPLTNRSETGSIVCVQAMANLTPVITINKCVMPELVGERGILMNDKFNNTHYDLWAYNIKELLNDTYLYKEYQKACKEWRDKYLWNHIAETVNHNFQEWIK